MSGRIRRALRAACTLLVASPLALGAVPAPADEPPPARRAPGPSVMGEWWFEPVESQGLVQVFAMELEPGRVTMTSYCRSGDREVAARASAPARVGDGRIETLRAAEDERSWRPGLLTCRVAVSPGTLRYELAGDRLVLHDPESGRKLQASRQAP